MAKRHGQHNEELSCKMLTLNPHPDAKAACDVSRILCNVVMLKSCFKEVGKHV